jgi:hypothetical protein
MSAPYYGDFPTSHTAVCMVFDSFAAATGASSATSNFANTDIQIYKDGGATQRASAAGIVVSTTFDTLTGLQMVTIDLSDNTDAGFYVAGHEYQVGVADVTIDSQTVRFWLGTFSIERAGGVLSLIKSRLDVAVSTRLAPTVAARTLDVSATGEAGVDWGNVGSPTTTVGLTGTTISSTQVVASVSGAVGSVTGSVASVSGAVGSVTGNVGGNVVGSVASVTGAVGSVTGNVGGNVVGSVGSVTAAVALTSGERNSVADAILDRNMTTGTDSGSSSVRTVRQALRFLRNKWQITSGTLTVYKEDDSTSSWTSTLTGTPGADPITTSDPA